MKKVLKLFSALILVLYLACPCYGTVAHTEILAITTIATDSSALYTLPSSTTAYVKSITIHNSNTTAETVKLWLVPNGGSVGDTNEIYAPVGGMAPGQTVIIEWPSPGLIMPTEGDAIHGDTTTASKVTIFIMGTTE